MYDSEYCNRYITKTIKSRYFEYKNAIIADLIADFVQVKEVFDIGCNVNAVIKGDSLRTKLEINNIGYTGIDVDQSYFDIDFVRDQVSDDVETYCEVTGIVGDIMYLPLDNLCADAITALDVLEHIPDLEKAFSEMHRVLRDDGILVMVIPSMYKLDLLNLSYLTDRRKSSHLNRMNVNEWLSIIEGYGFKLVPEKNKGIGYLSGLTYLLWLNEKYVPHRKLITINDTHTENSIKHAQIKNVFMDYDRDFDEYIFKKFDSGEFNMEKVVFNSNQVFNELKSDISTSLEIETFLDFFKDMLGSLHINNKQKEYIAFIDKLPSFAKANSYVLSFKKS